MALHSSDTRARSPDKRFKHAPLMTPNLIGRQEKRGGYLGVRNTQEKDCTCEGSREERAKHPGIREGHKAKRNNTSMKPTERKALGEGKGEGEEVYIGFV